MLIVFFIGFALGALGGAALGIVWGTLKDDGKECTPHDWTQLH